MVGELIKTTLEEEGEYKPVDGPEIGSLILIDRGEYHAPKYRLKSMFRCNGAEEPGDSSVLVLNSSFCSMKKLGVLGYR